MKYFAVAALLQLAAASHVQVRMPFLNPAGVQYVQNHEQYSVPGYLAQGYEAAAYHGPQHISYEAQNIAYQAQVPVQYSHQEYTGEHLAYAKAPHIGIANVPIKATVAVPTVQHVKTVTDVPVTKYEHHPAIIQKVVDVAKPAVKTRKFEVRRPAIQKQFYDIEEHIVVRPVGSALVELDEPLSKSQKGPALVSSLNEHGHQEVSIEGDHHHHHVAVTPAPYVAVTQPTHTVAITPASHGHLVSSIAPVHIHGHEHALPVQPLEHHQQVYVSSTPSPLHIASDHAIVASTPATHFEDAVVVEAAARNLADAEHAAIEANAVHQDAVARANINAHHDAVARANYNAQHDAVARANYNAQHDAVARANYNAHQDAVARANYNVHQDAVARANYNAHVSAVNAHHGVESYSNGAPHAEVLVNDAALVHNAALVNNAAHVNLKSLNHLSHEEAQDNQQKLIKLLTARGGVAEIGFGRSGHSEHVGDAGISRARVLSATPSPHHEPVEEKVNTRRIVVSRPVHTLQEIDVVEPATRIDRVAINQPTLIKTAKVGYERVETSVPVYGKALAPAIAHAQVPVQYYHK